MQIRSMMPHIATILMLVVIVCANPTTSGSPPAPATKTGNSGYDAVVSALHMPEVIKWDCHASGHPKFGAIAPTTDGRQADVVLSRFSIATTVATLLEHGFVIDTSIYEDLPKAVAHHDLLYIRAAAEAVAALPDVKPQITRSAYRLINHWIDGEDGRGLLTPKPGEYRNLMIPGRYPMSGAEVIEMCRTPLPLTIAPDPVRLCSFLKSDDDLITKYPWLPLLDIPDVSINKFIKYNIDYAFALYFDGAEKMTLPDVWAFPMPDLGKHEGFQSPREPYYGEYAAIKTAGKAVVQQNGLHVFVKEFKIGQPDGARCLGLVSTLSLFNKIWLVEVSRPDQPRCRYLAFPVTDANGAGRPERSAFDAVVGGKFENLLQSKLDYNPMISSHSLLGLPLPLPVDTGNSPIGRKYPQERLVVDEGIAASTPPVAIFRRGKTWRPYMPDYILDNRFSFTTRGEGEAEIAVAFANIDPSSLLKLLGALREVDVAPLLNDTALMQRLQQLAN